jgi:predicted nucleic acid-binding protein
VGLTHLDSGVVIGFLNSQDPHHRSAVDVMSEAINLGDQVAMSSVAYAECLVGSLRSGEAHREFLRFILRFPVEVVDIDEEIAFEAARLRSEHQSLRMPDAMVIAAAISGGASRLVTTDGGWPKALNGLKNLKVEKV